MPNVELTNLGLLEQRSSLDPAEARAFEPAWKRTRALEMAQQLFDLLGELHDLPENGPGSCVADSWDWMEDVIGMLEPDEPDESRLRIVGGKDARP
jgi:hypothetical protein